MKLIISDYIWGIDRRSGKYKESLLSSEYFNNVSLNDELLINDKRFIVIEINDNSITLLFYKSEITIEVDKEYKYKPRSFDGGHFYIISVTK